MNGVQQDTGSAGSGTLEDAALRIGASYTPDKYFIGKVYEFIIRNATTSTAEIEAVETRLLTKHGVA